MVQETLQDNYKIEQPLSEQEFIEFQKKAKSVLKVELPDEYCDFLRVMDGFIGYGCMLFGTQQRVGLNDGWIYGVIEFNTEIFLQYPNLIVLGCSGDDYMAYDSQASIYKFKNLDSTANNLNAEFTTFSDLIDDIFIPLLEEYDDED